MNKSMIHGFLATALVVLVVVAVVWRVPKVRSFVLGA